MEIIPAIDLLDGRCVRLTQGDFRQVTVFFEDPVDAARKWVDEGAPRIHLVDLNGSRLGQPQEIRTVERIARAVDVPLQLGGGIRDLDTARFVLDTGIDRVIIGTSAALAPGVAESIFQELGERAVLAVDARDGRVAVKGWEETTSQTAVEFARRMQALGARRVIYTDISRDGMMQGVNAAAMRQMAEALDIPVIASGGISSVEDILNLKSLGCSRIEGVIIGKALYVGTMSLPAALSAAAE